MTVQLNIKLNDEFTLPLIKTASRIWFMECDTCRAKLGSPVLCKGCLHNRSVIEELLREQ